MTHVYLVQDVYENSDGINIGVYDSLELAKKVVEDFHHNLQPFGTYAQIEWWHFDVTTWEGRTKSKTGFYRIQRFEVKSISDFEKNE